MGAARAAACAPAVAGTAAAGAIDGDVQDGHHGFRITPRRVPAVDKVAMDPSAQGQGLGKEHGVCKELQGRAELQRKAVARWLLR